MNDDPAVTTMPAGRRGRRAVRTLAALAAASALAGCVAPVLLGGAIVGTALSVADRRTAGAQIEDQAIELKAGQRLGAVLGEAYGNVSATSFNRVLLLTGQVPDEAMRTRVDETARRIEQVRDVVNELQVGFTTSLATRGADSVVTGRVKAALAEDRTVHANTIKVVTERGVVHLMGLVTEREAEAAVQRARAVPGVTKVVKVFEIVSDAQATSMSQGSQPVRAVPAADAASR